jgi:hypothetical protein
MPVIDRTYFTGPLAIANLSQPAVSSVVDTYILLKGEELLSKAMGESLKDAYLAGIEETVVEERWSNLRDGLSFTNQSDIRRRWVGFAAESAIPLNPVACYVWFHLQRDGSIQMSGIGSVQAQAENAGTVSPAQPLSMIWNQMANDIHVLWDYLVTNKTDYPEMNESEICYQFFNKINGFGI